MRLKSLCVLFTWLNIRWLSGQTETYRAEVDYSAFTKGKTYISGGFGLINANFILARTLEKSLLGSWKEVNFSKVPNVYVKGEYAVSNHLGVGLNIATGGLVAHVAMDSLNNQNVRIAGDLTYKSWSTLARINYHVLNDGVWDFYMGLGIGLRMNTVRVTSNDPIADRWDFPVNLGVVEKRIPSSLSFPSLGADVTLGLAYSLSQNIAFYTEMGMAKSALQAGFRVGF
ncbi:MAG: hypothetical protein FJ347_08220 [Sphingomonadales bacterium]|nr:hypothetical protein [Sphingomonadales bacterium]